MTEGVMVKDGATSRPAATASHLVSVAVPQERTPLARYGVALSGVLIALAVTLPLAPMLQRAIFVLFWPVVIGAAWYGGLGPAIVASVLSIAAADYFIVEPRGSIALTSPDDLIPLATFLFASTVVAALTNVARNSRQTATQAAAQNAELAHELELQAMELEQQLEESQVLSEELEQSTEELAERTAAAETAEAFTRGVLESIADPFVVHDAHWRFRFINEAAANVFRSSPRPSPESPIGRVLWEVYPDIVGTDFERQMRRAAAERTPVTFESFYPARGEWSRLSCFPLSDGGLATQWSNITARKRSEEAEHYLSRATEVLSSSLDYERTLEQLAAVVVPHLADWCAVHITDDAGTPVQLAVAHTDPGKVRWAREINEKYPPRPDATSGVPNVIRRGEPELHTEITDELLVAGTVDEEHLRLTRALGLRSAMIVPLVAGGTPIGALTLVSAESERRYTETDLPLATELARRAALSVENARLHRRSLGDRTEAERSARVANRLFSLTSRLSAAATTAAVVDAVLAEARATFVADRGTMTLIEDDGDTARMLASFGWGDGDLQTWRSYSVSANVVPTRVAVESGHGVFITSHADAMERFPGSAPLLAQHGLATVAILPIADGRVISVMSLAWTAEHPLPAEERDFMERFAAQCGQALGRAIAFEAERQARERTQRLQRITADLAAASDVATVARVIVANLRAVLEPRSVAVFDAIEANGGRDLVMTDEAGVEAVRRTRFGRIPMDGTTPLAEVMREGVPTFVPDAAAFRARFPQWEADGRPPGEEAWVALPIVSSTSSALGAIVLGFAERREFGPDLQHYVSAIADQARQAFERVRLLEGEHRAREAAEEANRAKTQFLATMSHELRTPLNAIAGYAELLSLGLRGPTTPEQQEDLSRIMRSQRHLLSVINDILNFARLEAGHVEYHVASVPVTALLGDLESLIRPQLASKKLEFECEAVRDDVVVRADAEKVRQVLLNLLANAVKFTPPGGRVRVTCEHDASHVRIHVSDTGIGIPLDRRGAIFEPFVQLHRTLAQPAEGTGLGLAISRDLARGMGGELAVDGVPGEGSVFTLTLDRVA